MWKVHAGPSNRTAQNESGELNMFFKNRKGFTLIELVVVAGVIVVVVVVSVYVADALLRRGALRMVDAALQAKDQAATVVHRPGPPTLTADQNGLIWTYQAQGLSAEINTFRVGPLSPDITISNVQVDVPRWTGTRTGQFVTWTGPGNVLEGQTATASFQTSADALIDSGILQANIFVNVIAATRGVRMRSVPTLIPRNAN
jgi:Tfp pilus assembly protein PilE